MSDFKKLLDRFEDHENNLKELGNALVLKYPQSKNLIELAQELGVAIEGLNALKTQLGQAIHEAESQSAMLSDLNDQMMKSEIYQLLSERDKKKLSEYLIQQKKGLATEEELEAFVKQSLEQKSETELLSEFSKAHILELGRSIVDGEGNEFEAYKAGTDILIEQFRDPAKKTEIVNDLAKILLKESPATIVKLFFSPAFKQIEQPRMEIDPIPMISPQEEPVEGPAQIPNPKTVPAPEPEAAPV
jgi:hypothetical protein